MSESDIDATSIPEGARRGRGNLGLVLLFGTLYLVQGIVEPTDGLITQPISSLLKCAGHSPAAVGFFAAILGLPWVFKPLYGLLSDFVPLFGTRRRSYLLLTTAITSLGLGALYFSDLLRGSTGVLLSVLLLPTLAVAFSDVVIDGLMVEKGQPSGLTGLLQSAQWTAMYAGMILAYLVGGYLSEHQQQENAFLICAGITFVTFVITWFFVSEQPRPRQSVALADTLGALRSAFRSPTVQSAALFVTLWSFNPINATVLYFHTTEELGLGEQFYGVFGALLCVGAMIGSLAYGTYCRRLSFTTLIHLSIVAGIVSVLAYCGMRGRFSAGAINIVVGFTYMTGNLVQLDMVARICPLRAAGTTFAVLMGLTNLSLLAATFLGSHLYEFLSHRWDPTMAFNLLVLIGALTNAACWLVVPLLKGRAELGT